MRRRKLKFLFWFSVIQAVLAFYLIASSFFRASLQARHQEIFTTYIQDYHSTGKEQSVLGLTPVDLAREAAKYSGWTKSAAGHTMLLGLLMLVIAIGQLAALRRVEALIAKLEASDERIGGKPS